MLEAVAQDYEAVKTTQTVVKIAFPIVVVLLLIALVWFIARRGMEREEWAFDGYTETSGTARDIQHQRSEAIELTCNQKGWDGC
jgi:hypothetical protein